MCSKPTEGRNLYFEFLDALIPWKGYHYFRTCWNCIILSLVLLWKRYQNLKKLYLKIYWELAGIEILSELWFLKVKLNHLAISKLYLKIYWKLARIEILSELWFLKVKLNQLAIHKPFPLPKIYFIESMI